MRFNNPLLSHVHPDLAGNKIRRKGVEPNLLMHIHFPIDPAYPGEDPWERSARAFANHPEYGETLRVANEYVPSKFKMEAWRTKNSPWSTYSLPSSYGAHEQKHCLVYNYHQFRMLHHQYCVDKEKYPL